MSLDKAAREVLQHYPLPGRQVFPLVSHGGFSGTSLWRVTSLNESFCLRAWPEKGTTASSLAAIHGLMDAAKDLGFVPRPIRGRHYQTVFLHAGRLWDLTTWMPGQADFWQRPSPRRLEAACSALAQLHVTWLGDRVGACPAVQRRMARWQSWTALIDSGWKPNFEGDDPLHSWAERAWRQLPLRVGAIPKRLSQWLAVSVPLQPCLCDIWHDHVLFTGDEVTGLIDFGSVKIDNVAVDLARMLGSMVGDNRDLREVGLAAYEKHRSLSREERDLTTILDETGTVLGAVNWLRWLYHERRQYLDRNAVAERLAALVRRMESWQ